nr:hypothetical protein [uncultured Acidovorax sp.]
MKKPKVVWATLANGIPVWMLETDTPNVYKTDKIKLLTQGVLMGEYEHVFDDADIRELFIYDLARSCKVRSLGPYRDKQG